ncbi:MULTISPECIES: acyl-CoA dehydrogenase [Cyanophyceae]|uniref:Acyl-coenzyme A dehydrogenase n=1 Tax=Leptolyngbya subtilissima DQ-A4 TaxID=2933933 RepID=A0ABV0K9G0_9CYAN|nr:acyl-CoA dehydrogenase [Nodosilinea sp. FACHB-141]MBD2114296.1 acyl-CoA dehydrogenase [Nodosilinea sp. FACHB-141]
MLHYIPISLTLLILLTFFIPPLRRTLISTPFGKAAIKRLPKISDTERAAIEAGQVWVEGEFFSGKPDWHRLLNEPYPQVPPDVQAFLDGPVEQVCQMATDWEIYQRKDLPPAVWKFLKHEKFFGMMIPQEFGGLGFSNLAYSAVMVKLASRSFTHVATVGVTNSLGPAKLLLRYGTPEQKARYLPRLAIGEEIPCFALTEPLAGSDAASLTSRGEVFKGDDGQLYLRLNWKKRYITLGAIATLIGLAFRLYDPDNLLGLGHDVGITCVLVPRETPGVVIDHRHDPMGVPFFNSPVEGHDVVLPIDQIIGGVSQAGQGWKMLMQTLAAGRGVSFPATCTGVAKLVSRVASAHSVVRQQFGLPIGRFEGVEEPLARIAGLTYAVDAARLYTCGAVDSGAQPAVVSAIAKYQTTELARAIVNDGMDILGGSGICRGPRNLLANVYTAIPIAVTVEGANILTRTLMIFGQGVIRCHPYLYAEIQALYDADWVAFDRLLWGHVGAFIRNVGRSIGLGLTQGRLAQAPVSGPTAPYYRKLSWASATFAVLTDIALIRYGGSLKRHENLTGRYADALSWLYLTSAVLRRFEAEGRPDADLATVQWAAQYGLVQIQTAFEGIVGNLSLPVVGPLLKPLMGLGLRLNPLATLPTDALGHQVAKDLQKTGEMRDRLTAGIYLPADPTDALGRLEQAHALSQQADAIHHRLKDAVRNGQLSIDSPNQTESLETLAHRAGLLTQLEWDLLMAAAEARKDAIQVDAFTFEEYEAGSTLDRANAPQPLLSDRG